MICSRCDRHESDGIYQRVSLDGSIGGGRCKGLASLAILLGTLFTTVLLPAYAQQDVAPNRYGPWAAANTAVAHPAQAPAAAHSALPLVYNRLQLGENSSSPRTVKLRATSAVKFSPEGGAFNATTSVSITH